MLISKETIEDVMRLSSDVQVNMVCTGKNGCEEIKSIWKTVSLLKKFASQTIFIKDAIVVVLIKNIEKTSLDEVERLCKWATETLKNGKTGNVYYQTCDAGNHFTVKDESEKFFFSGKSMMSEYSRYIECEHMTVEEQNYHFGLFWSFFNEKKIINEEIFRNDVLLEYLKLKYGNPMLNVKQLRNLNIISEIRPVSNAICENCNKPEENFDDSLLFSDPESEKCIKGFMKDMQGVEPEGFFNIDCTPLKEQIEQTIAKANKKSDELKAELEEFKKDYSEEQDLGTLGRFPRLVDPAFLDFSYDNFKEIALHQNDFLIGKKGTYLIDGAYENAKIKSCDKNDIYLHAVGRSAIDGNGTITIPEGVTRMTRKAFDFISPIMPETNVRKIVFPSTFRDDIFINSFSRLPHLNRIEVKSNRTVSVFFDDSKQFKIMEFKTALDLPNL